ncbi:MAG: four helix bundle protein [Chitinophagaceae bacterium]|nr:four helix bundle protein [Chitinophagaceae bacterium]
MLQLAHKNLDVYKISLDLVKEVYQLTQSFPREEQFVLVTQLRRAAISVCSNLAEGSARHSKPEKKRFYEISRSSLVEVDTQIELSMALEYLKKNETEKMESFLGSVFRMLSKMIGNLDK